jgi:peptide/nickel transport system substrate-binding protein
MAKKLNRREFLRFTALGAVGVAAAACTKPTAEVVEKVVTQVVKETVVVAGTPQVVEKEVTRVVEKEVQAQAEQVLRIMSGSSGSADFAFNCLVAGSDLQSWIPFLYVPPLYFDVDLNLKPGVFESWESNDDKTVWTFHINTQAVFSDGSPITASDVKGTWEIQADPASSVSRIRGYLGSVVGFAEAQDAGNRADITGIKVLDEHTVEVTLIKADPLFHWRIATCHLPAVKVEQYDKYDWDTYWLPENGPIFSGPFTLESFDPDLKTATLIPNPNWWMAEGPYLDRIVFTFVTDMQTRGAMIKNDQADVTLGPLPITMKNDYPDMFRPTKSFGYNVFWLSQAAVPTTDRNVRKALALSVDWEKVFIAAFPLNDGIPTNQIIDPDLPCIDTEHSWYKFDVAAAREALAASEYGSAENLPKLRVTPRGSEDTNNLALEAVMGFWRDNLGITNIEFKQAPDEWVAEDQTLINLSRDDVVIRFPDSATYMWTAAYSTGPVASGSLLGQYVNPDIDALLDQALGLDPDNPQRCELTLQAQVLFMDDYLVMPFGKKIATLNARDYVKDYYKGPDVGVIEPWKIKIEK